MFTQLSYHPTKKKTEILIYERDLGDKNFLEKNKNKSRQSKQIKNYLIKSCQKQ